MPVTASQTQHMVMLLFSEAIMAKKIEPIVTTRKITLDIQIGMEGIPTVRIFPARPVASISPVRQPVSAGARLSELSLCAAQQYIDGMVLGSAAELILLNYVHGE
jgi:hypothetical protein